ncbi:MAG TPA: glycosyl transferase family protein [Sphingopyxis sp.]|nr:glycosyl transferase family protein [Sphingopyxis sp.]HMP45032.1 glycosyl transferase family protein [Sphingopyxis sp.]
MGVSTAGLETLVALAGHELMLFASVGIVLIGLDDLFFDILWFAARRRGAGPAYLGDLTADGRLEGPLAVFVPAWDEAKVLPAMIRRTLSAWEGEDFRLYLGCYPNDAATLFAVSPLVAADPRLRLVIGDADGPTTKGENLNRLWAAMGADERAQAIRFAAVVLHDAEDVVHPAELALYRAGLTRHAMVQIPVLPLLGPGKQWVAGHYADEFAEAHGKDLALRSALGAPLPSAGVGCALTRSALTLLALRRGGQPFRSDSLTEDYELGILVGTHGLGAAFVAAVDADGEWIVSRGAFPATMAAAVRQKARWIAGIALAGWDHLGWAGPEKGGWIARWMLWRDRRAPLAAIVLLAGYAALVVGAAGWIGHGLFGWQAHPPGAALELLMTLTGALLLWRLGMRGHFAARAYGFRQGVLALPRAFVANIVAMLAARRAILLYWRMLRSGEVVWEKTEHREGDMSLVAPPPVRAR